MTAHIFMSVKWLSQNPIWPTWVSLYNRWGHCQRYELTTAHDEIVRQNGDGHYTVTYNPNPLLNATEGGYPSIEVICPA